MNDVERLQQEITQLRQRVTQVERDLSRTDHKLRRLQNFLTVLLDHLPVGVVAKEPQELRVMLCNVAAERMLGLTKSALGKTEFDLLPRAAAEFLTSKDQELLRHRLPLENLQTEICTMQGNSRMIRARKTLVLDEGNNVQYLLTISEDITECNL